MSSWGRDPIESNKPKWPWLRKGGSKMFGNNSSNNLANTYATEQGWTFRWPWGEEVLVAIGGQVTANSASQSPSPSTSPSRSASLSLSPSRSQSPSSSRSPSASASPSA